MLRILRRPGIIEPDDPDYLIVLESIRDMYQLRLIVDTMNVYRESPNSIWPPGYCGKILPYHNMIMHNTPGRNYQFQLYVAALCTNARLPTRHQEPDVTCLVGSTLLGIAAKRLKTIRAFKENVKNAADQVRLAGIPGIVALDLTLAQNPANRHITSSLESQLFVQLSQARSSDFFERTAMSSAKR
ncbi:MAG: hypothetical protein R3C11_27055 [Planctomycetaceae bacterium]